VTSNNPHRPIFKIVHNRFITKSRDLEPTVEETDTQFGFTWVDGDDEYFIRNPDDQFKRVSKTVIETLKRKASDTTVEELLAEVASERPEAAETIREFRDRDFIRMDAPVKRIDSPPDIAFWPRALGVGVLVVSLAALAYDTLMAAGLPESGAAHQYVWAVPLVVPLLLISTGIHEFGHYRVARIQGLDPSFGISVKNGVVPAAVTRTHGGWALPCNRRRWITLAGPAYGLIWTAVLFGLARLFPGQKWLGLAAVACFITQLTPLFPLFHGDGYLLLVDTFDEANLKRRGKQSLRRGRFDGPALYVAVSYAFYIGLFALELFIALSVGAVSLKKVVVGVVIVLHIISKSDLPSRLRARLPRLPGQDGS